MFIDIQEEFKRPVVQEAVGIDFGTTFCCIAYCKEEGTPQIIGDLIPSVVAYQGEKVLVGQEALDSGLPCLFSIKRGLGLQALGEEAGGRPPFQIAVDLFKGIHAVMAHHGVGHLKAAVVTVPAYFDESQRSLIKQAAMAAGFQVLRLLSEPTAAALTYSLEEEGLYGVYDLGGGTFDFSILSMHQDLSQVKATGGHHALGGDDIDEKIGATLFPQESAAFKRREGRRIKENAFQTVLSPRHIESIFTPFLDETLSICQATLEDAGVAKEKLKAVLLVGGSTKHPFVRRYVARYFGHVLDTSLDPDKAVAAGAALHAYRLTHQSSFLLLDVTPLSLGIETLGGLVEHILPRHHPLPAHKEMEFTTGIDGQTAMTIHVVQGEQGLVSGCRSLGAFELKNIPPLPKGKARITVEFHLDIDGLLTVEAYEKSSGVRNSLQVNAARGLSYDFIEQSIKQEGEDVLQRLWIQKEAQAREALQEVRRIMALEEGLPRGDLEGSCLKLEEACESKDLRQLMEEWETFSLVIIPYIEAYLTKTLKNHFEREA